jgi:hypothetical protein
MTCQSLAPLAAYIALLHVCGRKALQNKFRPAVSTDAWSMWRATPRLQNKRVGLRIIRPQLGTA